MTRKTMLREALPRPAYNLLRLCAFRTESPKKEIRDLLACGRFILSREVLDSFRERRAFVDYLYQVSDNLACAHRQHEMLSVIESIFSAREPGVVVEAGCYKGGSTAKLSRAAKLAGRELVVFDSFEGIPDNDEPQRDHLFGGTANFKKGDYCGKVDEVRDNVARWGSIDACRFVPGWFDDTMPGFKEPIVAAYIDVDLASSTKTCLKYLYPLLQPGGTIYSQDGHVAVVAQVFDDATFWADEVGHPKPLVSGLWKRKLVSISKPGATRKRQR